MRSDYALAMLQVAANVGAGDGRTVAGQNRIGRHEAFQLCEYFLLQRQFFRRSFKHNFRSFDRRRHLLMRRNAQKARRIVVEQVDDRIQTLRHRCADVCRRLKHCDLMPGGGKQIGNAVAHQPTANNSDLQWAHGLTRMVNPLSGSISAIDVHDLPGTEVGGGR